MSSVRLFALTALLCGTVAGADPLVDGTNYLLSQRDADGAFGVAAGEEPVVATSEALFALRALGLGGDPAALEAERYLASPANEADAELRLRRQRALSSTQLAPPFEALVGHAPGFDADDAVVLIHALLVLRDRGQALTAQGLALARRLAALQRGLGCYAFADNLASAELTALAALALHPAAVTNFELLLALNGSVGCLSGLQAPSGTLGSPAADALTLLAAQGAGFAPPALLSGTRQALLGAQASNGSWGSVRATALALQALLAQGGLDWRFPMAFFVEATTGRNGAWRGVATTTPSVVQKGSPLTVTLPITNASSVAAPATSARVTVRPALVGAFSSFDFGEFPVPALAPGATFTLVVQLPTSAMQPTRFFVEATVDSAQVFPDVDRSNNSARGSFTVSAPYDLEVTAGSLSLTSISATQLQVTALVRNLGQAVPSAVSVELFKGGRSGTLLASASLPAGLPRYGTFPVSATISIATLNGPTPFQVHVDFADVLPEASEDNNQATRWFDSVPSGAPQDLFASGLVILTPQPLRSGQPYQARFTVGNNSTRDARDVPVALQVGGKLTRSTIAYLPAQSSVLVTLEDSQTFYESVVSYGHVDPDRVLNDPTRSNDRTLGVSTTASVFGLHDLRVGVVQRSNADVWVDVENKGSQQIDTVLLVADDITSEEIARKQVLLGAGEGRRYVFAGLGQRPQPIVLTACVDPFGAIPEENENDNCGGLTFDANRLSRVSITGRDIKLTPPGAGVGEKVLAEVKLTHTVLMGTSKQVAAKGKVAFWQGRPGHRDGMWLGEVPFEVPVSQQLTVPFEFLRREGEPVFFAQLVEMEQSDDAENNLAGVSLYFERAVDTWFGSHGIGRADQVVSARLTGRPEPELVVGIQDRSTVPMRTAVEVLQRQPAGGYAPLWTTIVPSSFFYALAAVDAEGDGQAELFYS